MGRQLIKYTFGSIALYLIVANGTGFGTAFTQGANGAATFTKALQGRG